MASLWFLPIFSTVVGLIAENFLALFLAALCNEQSITTGKVIATFTFQYIIDYWSMHSDVGILGIINMVVDSVSYDRDNYFKKKTRNFKGSNSGKTKQL